jgi:hypothetical protein
LITTANLDASGADSRPDWDPVVVGTGLTDTALRGMTGIL